MWIWLSILVDYAHALINVWAILATTMLGVFEVGQFFFRKTWGWPKEHPFKIAIALLLIAQFGAYRELTVRSESQLTDKSGQLEAMRVQRDEANKQKARLEGQIDAKDTQIVNLQSDANQVRDRLADVRNARPIEVKVPPSEPVVIPAPIVNVPLASQPADHPILVLSRCKASFDEVVGEVAFVISAMNNSEFGVTASMSVLGYLDNKKSASYGPISQFFGPRQGFTLSGAPVYRLFGPALETFKKTKSNLKLEFILEYPDRAGSTKYTAEITYPQVGNDCNLSTRSIGQ